MAESKVWFITGCSTGLGRTLVQEVVRRGDRAVATARNISSIEDLKSDGVAVLQLDITASQDELNAKAAEAIKAFGQIDIVVQNAGLFQMGTWEDLTFVDWMSCLRCNTDQPVGQNYYRDSSKPTSSAPSVRLARSCHISASASRAP